MSKNHKIRRATSNLEISNGNPNSIFKKVYCKLNFS